MNEFDINKIVELAKQMGIGIEMNSDKAGIGLVNEDGEVEWLSWQEFAKQVFPWRED